MSTETDFHHLVSGIHYPMFIVTVAAGGERGGCLAGFVTQASIQPPRLMVLLSKANRTYRLTTTADALAVHFLSDANHPLATLFGERTGDTFDKFSACDWATGPGGQPLLVGTRGWVTGKILERQDCGDHVAHLIDVSFAQVDKPGPQLDFQTVTDMEPGHQA